MKHVPAKDRCECSLGGPYKPQANGFRIRCSRRAKTVAAGLNVCAQHARYLSKPVLTQ